MDENNTMVEFYFENKPLGVAYIPDFSLIVDRRAVAKSIGIKQYDEIHFYSRKTGFTEIPGAIAPWFFKAAFRKESCPNEIIDEFSIIE